MKEQQEEDKKKKIKDEGEQETTAHIQHKIQTQHKTTTQNTTLYTHNSRSQKGAIYIVPVVGNILQFGLPHFSRANA